MSRIGKKPILIPEGVTVELKDRNVFTQGPKGSLATKLPDSIEVSLKESSIIVSSKGEGARAMFGTVRALIANAVEGVVKGFTVTLEIHGIGYKARLEGADLVLDLGFTNPVRVLAPQGIKFEVGEGRIIKISGIDKELVSRTASYIGQIRKPDPYKGKGIRPQGKYIKLKPGKKAVGTAG